MHAFCVVSDVCDVHALDSEKRSALHVLCLTSNRAESKQSSCSNLTSITADASSACGSTAAHQHRSDIPSASSPTSKTAQNQVDSLSAEASGYSGSLDSKMAAAAVSCDKTVSVFVQIMKLLLKAGSSVNGQDDFKRTPLHICATHGHLEGLCCCELVASL